MDTITVTLIVGSARRERFADALVPWLSRAVARHEGVRLEVVDVTSAGLDGRDMRPGGTPTRAAATLREADAFVVLTPEYNHSFPGALKDAIDLHFGEWRRKPVGFVSYGARTGGAQAVEQLRQVFAELGAATVREAVLLMHPWNHLGDDGFEPPADVDAAADAMMAELHWWATALRAARVRDQVPA